MADLDSKYRPPLEQMLEEREELRGICIASQQKGLFQGGAVAIGVTDRRLLIQPLDRRGYPEGGTSPSTPPRADSRSAPRMAGS